MTAPPSAARTYRQLRARRLRDLLGQWVSEVEPEIFERIDVSPQILSIVGIGGAGADAPQFTAQVTVADMIEAGALG